MDIAAEIRARGCEAGVGPRGNGHEIQQSPEEFAEFVAFCQDHNVKTVLELGTGRTGGLARFMAECLGWQVTSVDINVPTLLTDAVEFIQLTTDAAYPYLRHRLFDLVFIDADHSYEAVKQDHENYGDLGRIVAFHDIAPNRDCCTGTFQYWQDMKPTLSDFHEVSAEQQPAGIGWYVNENQHAKKPYLKALSVPLVERAPDITVVSGTYNRHDMLRSMIESARKSVPRGVLMDFVIVDGGSTDGTLDYLRSQSDVTLIEQGELLGIKRAFTAGFDVARGRYVIASNDDVTFVGDSIFKAFTHLERHRECGGVAFSFDTPSKPGKFIVQYQGLIRDGQKRAAPYAQVGMFPREIGEAAGWWGGYDTTYTAKNYGLDNYISSRVYELGYEIHAIADAKLHDHLAADALRKNNNGELLASGRHPDSQAFLDRFNGGFPVFGSDYREIDRPENLRILYLPIYGDNSATKQAQRIGWQKSLARVGTVVEIDYMNQGRSVGENVLTAELAALMVNYRPHLVVSQIHTPHYLKPHTVARMRESWPSAVWVNWNGDESTLLWDDPAALAVMRLVDLQLTVSGDFLSKAVQRGINTAFVHSSFEPVEPDLTQPAHDVVFLGNVFAPLYPRQSPRQELEQMLRTLGGVNVGLYGHGWQVSSGHNLHDWAHQYGLYANAKITIVDNMYPRFGYVSDRLWKAFAYGNFVLWQTCPGAETLFGLVDGVHYIGYTSIEDLREKLIYWLDDGNAGKRESIGRTGREHVRNHHHYDARTRQLFDLLPLVKKK